jgi:Transposase, Mutator family
VVSGHRRREVLDAGPDRSQTARRQRHPHLLRRRAKGIPEAIEAIFPATTVQTCIVHLIRHSLKYVPRRQYDAVVKDLKPIYTAIDSDHAMQALEAFEHKWGQQLPVIGQAWRHAWEYVIPFMAFEPEVRRVIYTTNAIEALNRQLRKAVKTKGHFPTEDAARSSSTSRSRTPCLSGPIPAGGRKRCSRSRSSSETDCPSDPPPPRLHC